MKRVFSLLLAAGALALAGSSSAAAQEAQFALGGDSFMAGQTVPVSGAVSGDLFAAGYDVSVTAPVGGNAHAAGSNVRIAAPVGADLYAAGYAVTVTGTVGGNVTAAGQSVSLAAPEPVGGNARLAGQSVVLDGPVAGSVLVSAETLTLNQSVGGDLSFFGDKIVFGPEAVVSGQIAIHAPEEIAVPQSVAAAERVSYTKIEMPDYVSEAGRTAGAAVGLYAVGIAIGFWLLLVVIGAAFLALAPRGTAALVAVSEQRVLRRLGLGIITFAAVIGLVPVLAMTVFGLILVPFALAFIVVAWALAYLAGSTLVGWRIGRAFLPIDSNGGMLALLAVSLVVAMALGALPVIGWFITLLLTLFGFGCIGAALLGPRAKGAGAIPPASSAAPMPEV